MPKFLVLYRSRTSPREQMESATPEQMKAGMDAWMKWAGDAGSALADLGAPLDIAGHLEKGDTSKGTSDVSGYSLVEAGSADAVFELLRENPHLQMPENSIDVFEALPMPGS